MTEQEGYAFPEFLADTEWLSEHLHDDDIRVVDTDVETAYQRGHIPGAVRVPDNYQKDPTTGRVHILSPNKFSEMMESMGIGGDTMVVAYDNSRSLYAARLWWALRYHGHEHVKVLNGGWRKWLGEGRAVSIDPAEERPMVKFTPRLDDSWVVSTERLKEIYKNPDVVVWDVRSFGEYTGANPRKNRRPGHIPGAIRLEWLDMVDENSHTFKPALEMRRILSSNGITSEKEVVTH